MKISDDMTFIIPNKPVPTPLGRLSVSKLNLEAICEYSVELIQHERAFLLKISMFLCS